MADPVTPPKLPALPQQAQPLYPDGTPIPEEKQAEALSKGQLGYAAGARVIISDDKTGARYSVPSESVHLAISKGHRPESMSETLAKNEKLMYKNIADKHPYLAGALAASKSALDMFSSLSTAGLSDLAEAGALKLQQSGNPLAAAALSAATPGGYQRAYEKLDPATAEFFAKITEASPRAATAGKIAGGLAALAVPAPTVLGTAGMASSRLAGLGTRITEFGAAGGALRRAAIKGAEFGAEGALQGFGFGVGTEAFRAAQARQDITAERLLNSGIKGGTIGGVLGAGFGGMGSLGMSAIRRSAEKGVLAPESYVFKALGYTKRDMESYVRKYGQERADFVKKFALNESKKVKKLNEIGAAEAAEKGIPFEPLKDPLAGFVGGIEERAEAFNQLLHQRGKSLDDMYGKLDDTMSYESKTVLDQMDRYLQKMEATPGAGRAVAQKLRNEFITRQVPQDVYHKVWTRAMLGHADDIRQLEIWNSRDIVSLQEARKFRDQWKLRQRMDEKTNWKLQEDPEFVARQAMLKEMRGILERDTERQISKMVAEKKIPADSLERYKSLKLDYGSVRSIIQKVSEKAAAEQHNLLTAGNVLGAGLGAMHGGAAGALHGGLTGFALSKAYEVTKTPDFAAVMAKSLNKIRGGTDTSALKAAATVNKIVTKNATRPISERVLPFTAKLATKYSESSSRIKDTLASPHFASNQVAEATAPIFKHDPELGRATQQKLLDDIQYLQSKLPQVGVSLSPFPPTEHESRVARLAGGKGMIPRMSLFDMAKYNRFYRGLDNPIGELIRYNNTGRLSPEFPQILKERRPALLAQIRSETRSSMATMMASGKVPDRATRVTLSMMTGDAYDVTMKPEFMSSVQNFWAEEEAVRMGEQEAAGPTPGTRSGGRQVSERMRNRAQDRATASESLGRRE